MRNPSDLKVNSCVVIGEGIAALATVAAWSKIHQKEIQEGTAQLVWISSDEAQLAPPSASVPLAPLPLEGSPIEVGLHGSQSLTFVQELSRAWGIEQEGQNPADCVASGDAQGLIPAGLRELKNKTFREPSWLKRARTEKPEDVLKEAFSEEEAACILNLFSTEGRDFRLAQGLQEWTQALRIRIETEFQTALGFRRIQGAPLSHFKIEDHQCTGVVLVSGETILADQVYYCDRWTRLPQLRGPEGSAGLPKVLPFLKGRHAMSVLQCILTHATASSASLYENFYAPLHKESGEEKERHVWGNFSSDGRRSYWSSLLTDAEVEDNHLIAKRLRRMKSALEKMGMSESWSSSELRLDGESGEDFFKNVQSEQMILSQDAFWISGERVTHPIRLQKLSGLAFLTDGYGAGAALTQVLAECSGAWNHFQRELLKSNSEFEIDSPSVEPHLTPSENPQTFSTP